MAGLVVAYGIIRETGIGIVYGVPIPVVSRWFPDKKGLAVGLTIIGFGLSPLITAPLANRLIEAYTVRPTLRLLGIAMMVIITALSLAMKLTPKHWQTTNGVASPTVAAAPNQPTTIFKSRSFYRL